MAQGSENGRRKFVNGAGLAGFAGVLSHSATAATPPAGQSAKNMIFLVADGMGTGTLSLAHYWRDDWSEGDLV